VKKQYITNRVQARVLKWDHYTCRYCGSTRGPFHMDHVYPESKVGIWPMTVKASSVVGAVKNSERVHSITSPDQPLYFQLIPLTLSYIFALALYYVIGYTS